MRKILSLEFSELNERIAIELDNSQTPNTVHSIIASLPIRVTINQQGYELYTDETAI